MALDVGHAIVEVVEKMEQEHANDWKLHMLFEYPGGPNLEMSFDWTFTVEEGGDLFFLLGTPPRQVWILAPTNRGKDFGHVESLLNMTISQNYDEDEAAMYWNETSFICSVAFNYCGSPVFSDQGPMGMGWKEGVDMATRLLRLVAPGRAPSRAA